MIRKIQSYLNIVLLLFAAFGVVFFIVKLVIGMFEEEVIIKKDNLGEYVVQERVVTSYNVFNYLEACLSNLLETYLTGEYSKVYVVIGEKTKHQFSQEEVISILEDYGKNFFRSR